MRYLFFGFIIIVFISSCKDFFSSTLEVDPPEHTDQLVVHAYFDDVDSTFLVGVGQSYGLLETSTDVRLINNATVELFKNGNLLHEFDEIPPGVSSNPSYNYFKTDSHIFENKDDEFELVVSHPELGEARATQKMPSDVVITSAIFKENAGFNELGEEGDGIEITFTDPIGEDNYYEIGAVFLDTISPTQITQFELSLSSSDFNAERGLAFSSILLSDQTFDGKEYKLNALLQFGGLNDKGLYVLWRPISKDQYLYSSSVARHLETKQFALFSEPVSVYTNIENGLGIFGCASTKYFPVEF